MNDLRNPCGCNEPSAGASGETDPSIAEARAALAAFGPDGEQALALIPPPPTSDSEPALVTNLTNGSVIAAIIAAHKGPKIILL